MVLTLREQEIISHAESLLQEKTNTLGADGYSFSEPFERSKLVALGDVLRLTPDGYNDGYGLVPPEYDNFPTQGAVGTRRSLVRLHPYLPSDSSGSGGDGVQSFIAVSGAPQQETIDRINDVRLRPLISPRFSPTASHAAENASEQIGVARLRTAD